MKLLDNANLTVNVNDILTVDDIVVAIAKKMGLKNPEEFSLKNAAGTGMVA